MGWPAGTISTVCGTGAPGYNGDGLPAGVAQLNWPRDMAEGPGGSLYIADTDNDRIRKVGPDGRISTAAGTGVRGYEGDGGFAASARLNRPRNVEACADGTLYIADTDNHCLRRVDPDGWIRTVAGKGFSGYAGDGGLAEGALLAWPQDLAVGGDGSLYVADTGNHRIRKVSPDGQIATLAGTGDCGYGGDGGTAGCAVLARPRGVFVAPDGSVYVGDTENHRVRRVEADGTITTVAGSGIQGYRGDGDLAVRAALAWPRGVVVAAGGWIYVADCGNSVIRRVGPDGVVHTVAGTGREGYGGDGGPANEAALADPHGLFLAADGSLYVGEPRNHRVRKVWRLRDFQTARS